MYPNNIRKALAIAVVTLTALLIGGAATVASAFSVDVKNLHYSDDSGRSIMYDFSAGTVGTVLPNAILLDRSAEITRPSDETGTNYLWGQAPELPAISVTLPTAGNKAVISPVDAVNGGVAVLFASGTPLAATGTTSWFYLYGRRETGGEATKGKKVKCGPLKNACIYLRQRLKIRSKEACGLSIEES